MRRAALALVFLAGCGGTAHVTTEGTPALFVDCNPLYETDDTDNAIRDCYQRAALSVASSIDDTQLNRLAQSLVPCHELVAARQSLAGCLVEPNWPSNTTLTISWPGDMPDPDSDAAKLTFTPYSPED